MTEGTFAPSAAFLKRIWRGAQRRVGGSDSSDRPAANISTEEPTPFQRHCLLNVAAYELDKTLDLQMAAVTVLRNLNGRPASVTWWVDNVAMSERDRRSKKIDPPDAEGWDRQLQIVRVFDELISNPYRNINPGEPSAARGSDGPPPDYAWVELLITRDWRVWLIDHSGAFRTLKRLQHPETLTRCDRVLLRRLRQLSKEVLESKLGRYLSEEKLNALEIRRTLLVKHFDELIARNTEDAVLYDFLPERP